MAGVAVKRAADWYAEFTAQLVRDVDHSPGALRMRNHPFPHSITADEFDFIHDYIVAANRRSGFEVATGFGVSACAIGLGMQATQGRLVSMDAYIEERFAKNNLYPSMIREVYEDSDGIEIARALTTLCGISDVVDLVVGFSPDDVARVLHGRTLDFAFIDARHDEDALSDDVGAVFPFLRAPYTLMLHDRDRFHPSAIADVLDVTGGREVPTGLTRTVGLMVIEVPA